MPPSSPPSNLLANLKPPLKHTPNGLSAVTFFSPFPFLSCPFSTNQRAVLWCGECAKVDKGLGHQRETCDGGQREFGHWVANVLWVSKRNKAVLPSHRGFIEDIGYDDGVEP